ncbi:MAG: glucose-1-phosphate adenylyltransferase [Rhabdochlamydiaceae bacterium]|nr:glucose-1-phosphate adenylyltransferase [Rhabdochlamydiaceae bacterium]
MPDSSDSQLQEKVMSIVLAGGQGTRLYPLTLTRCKPAVSFGGKYRLIDIPISNSLNSKIRKIFVISQYFASGLQKHLSATYIHNAISDQNLAMLCPEETSEGIQWFKGTADAVRKNLRYLQDPNIEYYLILSGDQLYNIDLLQMVTFAKKTDADLVIASFTVLEKEAKRMGLLKIDANHQIVDFYEKPQTPDLLEKFQLPNTQSYLGSMGIYVFKKEALIQLLQETGDDFGKELIPLMIQRKNTYAFIYKGYWEDIGTVASFYEANLALIDQKNCLDIRDAERPIYTESQHLPNALIKNTLVDRSIISPGCVIEAKEICHSLIGTRTEIGKGSIIRDTLIMGNLGSHDEGVLSIGCDCFIQKAIIDEQVEIGSHVELLNKKNLQHYDGDGIFIRDGIIIVTSGTKVPDHFVL